MKITEILVNPQMSVEGDPLRFRIGYPVQVLNEIGEVVDGHVVEKILFKPDHKLFNSGLELDFACYVVFFEGIPERRCIRADMVTSLEAVKEETKSKSTEASANLPD
jgi:hypothetical protein